MKNHQKIFSSIELPTKLWLKLNRCVLGFGKVDGFIRVYNRTRHLVLFSSEKYDVNYNGIRYLVGVKSGIKYVFSHNYARINFNSYYSLNLKKTLTFHNDIINIKSVLNKDQNNYYYNMFL